MNLKYLNFGHISGFNTLSDEQKDEFIALYKEYVKHLSNRLRNKSRESEIVSIYFSKEKNYRVYFNNRSMALLKPKKDISQPVLGLSKETITTKQVRVSTETHAKIKEQAQKEGTDIKNIIDLAYECYLNNFPQDDRPYQES